MSKLKTITKLVETIVLVSETKEECKELICAAMSDVEPEFIERTIIADYSKIKLYLENKYA